MRKCWATASSWPGRRSTSPWPSNASSASRATTGTTRPAPRPARALPRPRPGSTATAAAIYWQSYWAQSGCVYFPLVLAYQLSDAGVNHGPSAAIKLLQRAVGTDDDGIIGPQTLDAAKAMSPYDVAILFLAQREQYFTDCSGWPDNGRGWSRRVAQDLQYAQRDATCSEEQASSQRSENKCVLLVEWSATG
ncbi:hypothetical protein R0381_002286 [Jeongeupia wiesaeckerbachi]|uniref:glycosyl hydrolase 108 family protein n=1 Tax=Jeongeupia wiesaeckerbachi TaxID=3051218 RepID=UPI003D8005B0